MNAADDRFLSLVNTIDGIVWEADAKTYDFTFVSDKAESLLGYPCSDWFQPGFWAEHIHPDDRSWAVSYCKKSTERLEPHEFEYRFICANGDVVWLRDLVTVIAKDGEPDVIRGIMIDVTDQKNIIRRLSSSEARLNNFITGTGTGTWEWDVQSGAIEVNREWAKMLGYSKAEVEPVNFDVFSSLVHPEDLAYAQELLDDHFQDHTSIYSCKIRMRHKMGFWIWVHTQGRVTARDYNNQPLTMYGTHQDITDLIHKSKALEATEERYKTFVKTSGTGAWEYHPNSGKVWCSEEYFSMLGRDKSDYEVISENQLQHVWENWLHPDDRDAAVQAFNQYLEHMEGTYENTFRMSHANGSWVWIWSRCSVIDYDGVPVCVGTHINISKQKESESQLLVQQKEQQLILDNLLDAVIAIDASGKMLSMNRAAQTLFGYTPEEAIGKNVSLLMDEPHRSNHDAYLGKYLSSGRANIIGLGREVEGMKKDGTLFPMRLSVSELPSDESSVRRFIGSCHDLTSEKEQERLLNRSSKMDALGKLVGGIAHDFNNILGIMLGYAEMLEANLDAGTPEAMFAKEIESAGERATELTRKLLNFSSTRMTAATSIDLNETIESGRLMLEKAITPSIELKLHLEAGLWEVWSEKSDLENVLLNMAINASHAMAEHGTLTLTTENVQLDDEDKKLLEVPAGDYVRLSVTDTGCGMDAATQQQIFDPFFTTKGDAGTGLGLAQTYGMMQRCGGAIRVYSEPGLGTQFNLYFPRYRDEAAVKTEPEALSVNLRGTESVLIVDDEPQLRALYRELLSHKGYKVEVACDGSQALAMMQERSFDLVLSDIIMPGMNGAELAAQIQERYPHTLIQLMSGFSDESHGEKVNEQLYKDRLIKPLRHRDLLSRLRELLDRS